MRRILFEQRVVVLLVIFAASAIAAASSFGQVPQLFGQGPNSVPQQRQPQQPLPLENPTGLHAAPGDAVGEVRLRWTPVPDATDYWIWAVQADGHSGDSHRSESHDATVEDLEPGREYWFAVIASRKTHDGGVHWSRLSNWAKFTVPSSPKFKVISTGSDHSCGIRMDGTLECWGSNYIYKSRPPEGRFKAVSVNGGSSCAITVQGEAWCWGSSPSHLVEFLPGREPDNHTFGTPRQFSNEQDFEQISTSPTHTCALRDNGKIVCKGRDPSGQVSIPAGTYLSVTANWDSTCALRTDKRVLCWGFHYDRGFDVDNPPNLMVANSHTFRSIDGNCGITDRSNIVCWPDNVGRMYYGKVDQIISIPDEPFLSVRVGSDQVCGLTDQGRVYCYDGWAYDLWSVHEGPFQSVDVGGNFACALSPAGDITCWGHDGDKRATPPGEQFVSIDAGHNYTCGILLATRRVSCWGDIPHPPAPSAEAFKSVSAGFNATCGVLHFKPINRTSQIVCWGGNGGDSPPLGHFDAVSVGFNSACAIRGDSTVACWSIDQNDPVPQPPDGSFRSISVHGGSGCGVRMNDTVVCWGFGETPSLQPPQGTFISVVAENTYACGIRTSGELECWGDTSSMKYWTVPLPKGKFASIASDFSFSTGGSCGVLQGGELSCWGYKGWGFDTNHLTETLPGGTYSSVSTGSRHACAIKPTGKVVCWGYDGDKRATPPGSSK